MAKEHAKTRLLDHLQLIHWLHDQGQWESTKDIFLVWQDYIRYMAKEAFIDLETFGQYDDARRLFYVAAWTLIYFFIEGGDEFFSEFFKKYLAYENANSVNDFNTAAQFFDQNLTPEQIKDFDSKWGQFVLNLTYDKI